MNIDDEGRRAGLELRELAARTDDHGALQEVRDRARAGPHRSPPHDSRGLALALAVAAIVAVVAGVAIVTRDGGVDVHTGPVVTFPPAAPESHEAPRAPEVPQQPDDGKDSLQLPITASPATGLVEGSEVTLSGAGFKPSEQVGLVQCATQADNANRGIEACDLSNIGYGNADQTGKVVAKTTLHRLINTPHDGAVDCASAPQRCFVAMGAIADYDRSGGIAVDFDPAGPLPNQPTIAIAPATGLHHGQTVTVTGAGFAAGANVEIVECGNASTACDHLADGIAAPDGTLSVTTEVEAFVPLPAGAATACLSYPGACVLRAQIEHAVPSIDAALQFDKASRVPELPLLEAAQVKSSNGKTLATVRGTGFEPHATVGIRQCLARPAPDSGGSSGSASGVAQPPVFEPCTGNVEVQADADGRFSLRLELVPSIEGRSCRDDTCWLLSTARGEGGQPAKFQAGPSPLPPF
jgi:hypothetical protein